MSIRGVYMDMLDLDFHVLQRRQHGFNRLIEREPSSSLGVLGLAVICIVLGDICGSPRENYE